MFTAEVPLAGRTWYASNFSPVQMVLILVDSIWELPLPLSYVSEAIWFRKTHLTGIYLISFKQEPFSTFELSHLWRSCTVWYNKWSFKKPLNIEEYMTKFIQWYFRNFIFTTAVQQSIHTPSFHISILLFHVQSPNTLYVMKSSYLMKRSSSTINFGY